MLVWSGCQTQNQQSTTASSQESSSELMVPFSHGPDSPPDMKGPTAPPPAVSEQENVTYTLP